MKSSGLTRSAGLIRATTVGSLSIGAHQRVRAVDAVGHEEEVDRKCEDVTHHAHEEVAHADGLSVASKSSVDPRDPSTNGEVCKAAEKKQADRRPDEVVDPRVDSGALKCKDQKLVLL